MLCTDEADELDQGGFPHAARLGQIARQAGFEREYLVRLLQSIVLRMTAGLWLRPTEHTEGDES
jgi:hypothetical protein